MTIVKQAYSLFVETLALATTDITAEPTKWHNLYSKECELFSLMRQFTPEQSAQYRSLVAKWDVDPKND